MGRSGPPSPDPIGYSDPDIFFPVPVQPSGHGAPRGILSITLHAAFSDRARHRFRGGRPRGPDVAGTVLGQAENRLPAELGIFVQMETSRFHACETFRTTDPKRPVARGEHCPKLRGWQRIVDRPMNHSRA